MSENKALCRDIDRMIAVSLQGARRPVFPVGDAMWLLTRRHRLGEEEQPKLLALISQRCIGMHVPLSVNDFDRLGA